ncbi:MAG: hypothetical protein HY319_20775 [Armatimonadetes bacterium]|nr:hypothetical protein [Armatimonadota bacterium]
MSVSQNATHRLCPTLLVALLRRGFCEIGRAELARAVQRRKLADEDQSLLEEFTRSLLSALLNGPVERVNALSRVMSPEDLQEALHRTGLLGDGDS